jgi:hypothetical protein
MSYEVVPSGTRASHSPEAIEPRSNLIWAEEPNSQHFSPGHRGRFFGQKRAPEGQAFRLTNMKDCAFSSRSRFRNTNAGVSRLGDRRRIRFRPSVNARKPNTCLPEALCWPKDLRRGVGLICLQLGSFTMPGVLFASGTRASHSRTHGASKLPIWAEEPHGRQLSSTHHGRFFVRLRRTQNDRPLS